MGWPHELPLLLAGPVVRRVEPGSASVWVALRSECTVRLSLWEGLLDAGTGAGGFDGPPPLATGQRQTRRIGERLHIAVVTVHPGDAGGLRPGTTYSYNVRVDPTDGPAEDLKSLGLLLDDPPARALGYAPGRLPSFALPPPELTDLKLVQASCRLINDGNDPGADALPWLDDLIRREHADPRRRPHQLYLTGDQIYADHVALSVLPMLTALGNRLIGRVEHVRLGGGEHPVDQRHLPTGWRHRVAAGAGLTSTSSESHLFSLAEYCAMYLAAWSPDVWPPGRTLPPGTDPAELLHFPGRPPDDGDSGDGDPDDGGRPEVGRELRALLMGIDEASVPHLDQDDPCGADHSDLSVKVREDIARVCAHRKALREHLEPEGEHVEPESALVERYRSGVAAVRRALANVPSYMIFDDHEVTDDWNITGRWADTVAGTQETPNPLGRAILRNGLLSYALFQGEGNYPERYADAGSPEARLLQRATTLLFPSDPTEPLDRDAAAEIDALLGLAEDPPQVRWDYQVPGSRHTTIVLDTRTRRAYRGDITPPALISPPDLDRQIPEGPLPAGVEVLVVVSAAPVLGLPVIDTIVGPIYAAINDFRYRLEWTEQPGRLDPDREAWVHDPESFEALLRRLAPYRRVVFLSGDVHYAMGAELSYWRAEQDGASRFVQLTSSGACNSWPRHVSGYVHGLAPAQRVLELGVPVEQLAWQEARPVPVLVPPDELVTPAVRFRLDRSPVLVPSHGWPPGTEHDPDHPPDWSWRLRPLADRRPADELPEAARPEPVGGEGGDVDPTGGIDAYHAVARRHAAGLTTVTNSPRLAWLHNLGIVSFPPADGQLLVRHEILSRHPHADPPEVPGVYTRHEARLDGTEETAPTLRSGS